MILGLGGGRFVPAYSLPAGAGARWMADADINEDGHLDLAIANARSNDVLILLGDGVGGFSPTGSILAGQAGRLVTRDFDVDGHPDLAPADRKGIWLASGDGTGSFAAAAGYAKAGEPVGLAVLDADDDGLSDLATASTRGLGVLLNRSFGRENLKWRMGNVGLRAGRSENVLNVNGFEGNGEARFIELDPSG